MFNYYHPLTIRDVVNALEALRHVQRPYGDNEGDAINHPDVYADLPTHTQQAVDLAWRYVREYCCHIDGAINSRSETLLKKHGYQIHLGPNQYDPMLIAGVITVGDWNLDLSDETAD